MRILVTGSTGLVGTALVRALVRDGHMVCRLVRTGSSALKHAGSDKGDGGVAYGGGAGIIEVPWNPTTCDLEGAPFGDAQGVVEGADAVVNLAGAGIAEERWTEERKAVLKSSRVHTTRALVTALEKMSVAPKTLVSASAIGYYGSRGDDMLTEESEPGDDFLGRLAQEWEAEAVKAEALGMRVVRARFGIILAPHGGALLEMMRPFRYGVGGKIGSGQQWMSWITLEDVVQVIRSALERTELTGAMNVVSPQPVRNEEFARELARAMHRPGFMPAPAFALKLALGTEMADELLLSSQRAMPCRLQQVGYEFLHPELSSALGHALAK